MREIKFRAWMKEMDGDEEYGPGMVYFGFREGKREAGFYLHDDRADLLKHSPIMQFTGLVDKNGKEIYEGDVYKVKVNSHEWIYQVSTSIEQFGNMLFGVLLYDNITVGDDGKYTFEKTTARKGSREYIQGGKWSEVIGNIYENPELMGGKDGKESV